MSAKRAILAAGKLHPRARRQALAALGCGLLAMSITACESTEQESAQLAKNAKHAVAAKKFVLGARSRAVHASQVTLLQSSESAAVAVRLTSTGSQSFANVPLAIDVKSGKGAPLYTNETPGLEASLQHMPLVSRAGGWWVDDQVLGVNGPATVSVRVGSSGAHSVTGAVPEISTSGVHLSELNGEHVIDGVLSNPSRVAQKKMPVFAVTLKAGKVTAAGRAIVPSLPAGAAKVAFQIFLVGNPAGAKVQVTVAPTAT